jgi:8-oxo-dGTP pyrophosphatase MutT (NUDIX family)
MNYVTFKQLGIDIGASLQQQVYDQNPYPLLEEITNVSQLIRISQIPLDDSTPDKQEYSLYVKLWSHYKLAGLCYNSKLYQNALYYLYHLSVLVSRYEQEYSYPALCRWANYFLAELYWNQQTADGFVGCSSCLSYVEGHRSLHSFSGAILVVGSRIYDSPSSQLDALHAMLGVANSLKEEDERSLLNYINKVQKFTDLLRNIMRSQLIEQLRSYTTSYPEELESRDKIVDLITTQTDCFKRSFTNPGHITASAWLLNFDGSKVLLMHHVKLNKWLQPGGHCDGSLNTLAVAIKEAQEESGIEGIAPVANSIFDLDIHYIPERKMEPAHYHYDIRYLLKADKDAQIVKNHESNKVEWFDCNRTKFPTSEPSVIRMFNKWESLIKAPQ